MRVLFAPGIAVMGRLPNQKKLPLLSFLFILPLAILCYETYAQLSTAVAALVLATFLLALYGMAAFYIQAGTAWRELMATTRRVSDGDLTAGLDSRLGGQFGLMMHALKELTRSLGQIVAQVRSSSNEVAAPVTWGA